MTVRSAVCYTIAPMGILSGGRPANLGVRDGKLAPPKRTPNCVSSQADANDRTHYIEPLRFSGPPARAWAALKAAVQGMERVRVVREERGYLYAEFTSRLMRYIDDAEFYLDEKAGTIQVRSASRLGRRDFGVNRERIEAVRARMTAAST
jgi:uncharacterized protein (DUF1499 family)